MGRCPFLDPTGKCFLTGKPEQPQPWKISRQRCKRDSLPFASITPTDVVEASMEEVGFHYVVEACEVSVRTATKDAEEFGNDSGSFRHW